MINLSNDIVATGTSRLAAGSLLAQLVTRLQAESIRYCHWKGSLHLSRVLSGEGDLDLLVDRRDVGRFESVLALLGFKRAVDPVWPRTPSVLHFYGLDPATGALIHLHVYYHLVIGESLLENYRLPLEELLLRNVRTVDGVPVAQAGVALVVFVVRTMVNYASLSEQLLIGKDGERQRTKLEALLVDEAEEKADGLLAEWLPAVPAGLFRECLAALREEAPWLRCFRLGRRLRRQLRGYRCFGALAEAGLWAKVFLQRGLGRLLRGCGSRKDLAAGGEVVAFVGLDASGKSTLVREARGWLGKVFRVRSTHLGKPPSAWLTLLPNLARRLVARMTPGIHMSARQGEGAAGGGGLLYRLRMVTLAWDRRALAMRMHRRAANGWVVLCDRYPSAEVGTIDGASLAPPPAGVGGLAGWLARLENRLYRQVPPPDVVIHVAASVEVAMQRNRQRREPGKEKSDAYVAYNHRHVRLPSFPGARTIEFDTDRPRPEAVAALRHLLWQVL